MSKLWGGRFDAELHPLFEAFNQSLSCDHELVFDDITGSVAWAKALGQASVLSEDEVESITGALQDLASELEEDNREILDSSAEDVHSFVEGKLLERIGELAKKLHTGRSRNDQVATDLKLYMQSKLATLVNVVLALIQSLVDLAAKHVDLPMPGFTHLQRAQPITVGHHAMAYVEMLGRDLGRLLQTGGRMDTCPLGSGALAGTAFPIDREALAKELGFEAGPTQNSLDAVSDRDHVCETAFACTMIMLHLSRLAEDWIFFLSQEAGYLRLGDPVTTGSSLMPQKKNPDALELLRGRTGRVMGRLQGLLTMLKGLPLAYNKDMQEDKEALIDSVDTTIISVGVAIVVVESAEFDEARCREQSGTGYMNATDLADLLVAEGVPFRDAHEQAGRAVRRALELGVELVNLPLGDRKKLLGQVKGDLHKLLSVEAVLARRSSTGGTAPEQVRKQVASWKAKLAALEEEGLW